MTATPGWPSHAVHPRSSQRRPSARVAQPPPEAREEQALELGIDAPQRLALHRTRVDRVAPLGRRGPGRGRRHQRHAGPGARLDYGPGPVGAREHRPEPAAHARPFPGAERRAGAGRLGHRVDRAARDGDAPDALEQRREARGRGREELPPRRHLERGAGRRGEGGRAGAQQPHGERGLVAVPRERERLLQPDAGDRQVGPEGHAGRRAVLRLVGGEAEPPQIDRPGGAAQDQARLRGVVVAGEADRRSRPRVGPETRRPARPPGQRPRSVEGEHDLEALGGDPHAPARLVRRGPGHPRSRDEPDGEHQREQPPEWPRGQERTPPASPDHQR